MRPLTCAPRGFLDIIRNYGPQALASYYGGSGLEDSMRANAGLFRVFGSPNDMGPGSICNTSSCVFTPMTTYGVTEAVLVKDIGHSEIIFCWGKIQRRIQARCLPIGQSWRRKSGARSWLS